MKRPAGILALGLAEFCLPASGRQGPLRPPASPRPQAVRELAARQRGASVVLEWVNPSRAVDGRPLRAVQAAEVWLLDLGAGGARAPLSARDFAARARLGRRVAAQDLQPAGKAFGVAVVYPLPGEGFRPTALAFSIRVLDEKGRPSELCAAVPVEVRACPGPPAIRQAEVFADRIEVRWEAPAANIDGSAPAAVAGYTVWRAEAGAAPESLTPEPVAGLVFADRDFRFGVTYDYIIRAVAPGAGPTLESDASAPRRVVPQDIFPPAAPSGLVVLAGAGVISLSWTAGREADLAGYRVWRRETGGSAFVPLNPGPLLRATTFTDTTAEKGKTYVYAVSAADKSGNVSPRAEAGPVGLKGTAS